MKKNRFGRAINLFLLVGIFFLFLIGDLYYFEAMVLLLLLSIVDSLDMYLNRKKVIIVNRKSVTILAKELLSELERLERASK